MGNRYRKEKLEHCRQLLGMTPPNPSSSQPQPDEDYRDRYEKLTGHSLRECPVCHRGRNDHSQVIGQGSFSPGHPRYLMIDPPDSKSLRSMNSKLLSRGNGLVLRAFRLPCDQPSTSYLSPLMLPEAMNTLHRLVLIHYLSFVLPTSKPRLPYKTHREQTSCRRFSPMNF